MPVLIIFPTIASIHQAALHCKSEQTEITALYLTSRRSIARTIQSSITAHTNSDIIVFSPFFFDARHLFDDQLTEAVTAAAKLQLTITWYGEGAEKISAEVPPEVNLHPPLKSVPLPLEIENYLRYKKTLTFLGNAWGGLAIEELQQAIRQLADFGTIPEDEAPTVKAFADTDFPAIEGRTPRIRFLKKEIRRVAISGLSKVLLLGESGTGKEAAAFFLHALDPKRRKGQFGAVNCAGLQEELLISELFGHEKGAFTGATEKKRGVIATLNGGTLFLDELPDMPQRAQAMLLRFLESGTYTPLGSTRVERANTKIVSAAQKSRLVALVNQGKFRKDLYYRLAAKIIPLPGLAEIQDDIPDLITHLTYRIGSNSEERDQAMAYFFGRLEELKRYHWPGNVRELANYIVRRVKLGEEEQIELGELELFSGGDMADRTDKSEIPGNTLMGHSFSTSMYDEGGELKPLETVKREYAGAVKSRFSAEGLPQKEISRQLGISPNTLKKLLLPAG